MGLELFGTSHDITATKMDHQLPAAATKDRKHFKTGDHGKNIILATAKGTTDTKVESVYGQEMLKWISDIRERFRGSVIRRTVWSVDNMLCS
jgi:hypothetical protein